MSLTPELRRMVFRAYFANKNTINGPITIEGKRKGTGEPFAKQFSNTDKNRVALLSASKTINAEAYPVLYALPLRFDGPGTLLTFLGLLGDHLKQELREIHVVKFAKGPSLRPSFNFLATSAYFLRCLRFEEDVTKESDVNKAVKAFWIEMQRFFETLANVMKNEKVIDHKSQVVDILDFGPKALYAKDMPYDEDEVEEFKEALRAKLK